MGMRILPDFSMSSSIHFSAFCCPEEEIGVFSDSPWAPPSSERSPPSAATPPGVVNMPISQIRHKVCVFFRQGL